MATKGEIRVVGVNERGEFIIEPCRAAAEVLARASWHGERVEVRQTTPTRGPNRRARDHKLRLVK